MAYGVTTEWDDIQRKLGNLPPLEKKVTAEQRMREAMNEAEEYDPLEHKNMQQLDELEDDVEEDILRQYREKRLKEMMENARKPRFGSVLEISKSDFVREVNEAPQDVWVIIHLYQDYNPASTLLNRAMDSLSHKFINHKFIKIIATKCVENFQDADVPALLIYRNGQLHHNFLRCVTLFPQGKISDKGLEWALSRVGVLETDLEELPQPEFLKVMRHRDHSSDESSSEDERCYSSTHMPDLI